MSTVKVSNIQHASAASAAITLDANGQATLNGLAYPTSGSLSGRNRIINGAMEIAQRGTSHTANGYTLDRWTVFNSGGTFTLSQQTAASGSQPENGMAKFLRIARTSPSGIFYLSQKIEDVSLYDGFAVTVSFYAKANTNITLPVRLIQEFGSGGSAAVTVGTVNTSITTSWAKYTANFTLPSLSGKTIGTSSFLELVFDTPATYSTLDITGVQLEAGTVATPFERRSYGQELALCQRYYEKSYNLDVAPGTVTDLGSIYSAGIQGTTTTGEVMGGNVLWKAAKRANPTVVIYDVAGNAGKCGRVNYAVGGSNNSNVIAGNPSVYGVTVTSGSGASAGGIQYHFTASSEL